MDALSTEAAKALLRCALFAALGSAGVDEAVANFERPEEVMPVENHSLDIEDQLRVVAERAAADPDFLRRLFDDPEAAVGQADLGFTLMPDELRAAFDLGEASDATVVEALKERLSKIALGGFSGGGGTFGGAGGGGSW